MSGCEWRISGCMGMSGWMNEWMRMRMQMEDEWMYGNAVIAGLNRAQLGQKLCPTT